VLSFFGSIYSQEVILRNELYQINSGTALQMKASLTVLLSNHTQAENWGCGQNLQQQVCEFINKEVDNWKTLLSGTTYDW
jgi:hypothetical protein